MENKEPEIPDVLSQKMPHLAALTPEERAREISKELCQKLREINIDSELESASLINFIYENVEHNEVEEFVVFNVIQLFLQYAELTDEHKFYLLQLLNAIFQFDPTNRFLSVFCHSYETYTYIMQTLLVMFSDKPDGLSNTILALHLWIETSSYQDVLTTEFKQYVRETLPYYEEILKAQKEKEQTETGEFAPDSKRDPSTESHARKYTLGCKLVMCHKCNILVHSDSLAAHENEHLLRERREKTGGVYCRAWNMSASQWMMVNTPPVAKDEYIRCALRVGEK